VQSSKISDNMDVKGWSILTEFGISWIATQGGVLPSLLIFIPKEGK